MLYVKLALRNLKRSLKEYSIYVFTVTITMTLLYAFFAIAFSGEMQDLVTTYDNIKSIMIMVSILVTLIIAWLIYYISNFILQKRSREFGMYLLLGMKRTQVSRMFLFEQLALGAVGFFIGCVLGIFVYEILHLWFCICISAFLLLERMRCCISLLPEYLSAGDDQGRDCFEKAEHSYHAV